MCNNSEKIETSQPQKWQLSDGFDPWIKLGRDKLTIVEKQDMLGFCRFHGFMNITGGRPGLWQYWLWSLNSNIKKKTVYILKCNDGKT